MLRNPKLAKSIFDMSWSVFVANLQYKADWYGRKVTKVDAWFSSYQLCSECGHEGSRKLPNIRGWKCSACHFYHDREVNVSKNILNKGMQISSLT